MARVRCPSPICGWWTDGIDRPLRTKSWLFCGTEGRDPWVLFFFIFADGADGRVWGVSDTEQGQDYEQVFLRRGVDEGAELLKSNMALLGVVQSKLEKERAVGSGMSLLGEAEAKKANDHEEGPSMGLMVEAEAEQKMGGGGVLCLCRTIRSAAWSLSSI